MPSTVVSDESCVLFRERGTIVPSAYVCLQPARLSPLPLFCAHALFPFSFLVSSSSKQYSKTPTRSTKRNIQGSTQMAQPSKAMISISRLSSGRIRAPAFSTLFSAASTNIIHRLRGTGQATPKVPLLSLRMNRQYSQIRSRKLLPGLRARNRYKIQVHLYTQKGTKKGWPTTDEGRPKQASRRFPLPHS